MSKLSSWFWFPGIVAHELAHYVACLIVGLPVSRVQLFGSDPHVEHAAPADLRSIIVAFAPLAFNILLGFWSWNLAQQAYFSTNLIQALFWSWVTFTLLFLSFPSRPDIRNAQHSLHQALFHSFSNRQVARSLSIILIALPLYILFIGLFIIDVVWPLRFLAFIPLMA